MDDDKNWFNKFASVMDQNIRGVQYGVYCVAGLGLVVAFRSVRPFIKFTSPSDIPGHFIQKKMQFHGKVTSIVPSSTEGVNPLLQVDHYPILKLPFSKKTGNINLEVSGVDVTANGFAWMNSTLLNEEIKFIPLRTDQEKVYSMVFKKGQNIGKHLVSIGFASVAALDFKLEKDPYYLKYYQGLLENEQKAERKGAGIWSDTKPSFMKQILRKLRSKLQFSHS